MNYSGMFIAAQLFFGKYVTWVIASWFGFRHTLDLVGFL